MKMRFVLAAFTLSIVLVPLPGYTRQAPGGEQAPKQPMSFFVTSVGSGRGGDLGGLAGADANKLLAVEADRLFASWADLEEDNGHSFVYIFE
jgi:hypothetical protein